MEDTGGCPLSFIGMDTDTRSSSSCHHEGYGDYKVPSKGVISNTGRKGSGSQIPPSAGSDEEGLYVAFV